MNAHSISMLALGISHGTLERPGDLAVGCRRMGGGHMKVGRLRDLAVGPRKCGGGGGHGIWLSGIGGGGFRVR